MTRTAKASAGVATRKPAPPKPVTAAAQRKADAAGAGDTADYIVGDCPIQHDGVLYLPGHEIALTAPQAERLGERVTAIAPAAPGTPTTLA